MGNACYEFAKYPILIYFLNILCRIHPIADGVELRLRHGYGLCQAGEGFYATA